LTSRRVDGLNEELSWRESAGFERVRPIAFHVLFCKSGLFYPTILSINISTYRQPRADAE